MLYYFKTEEQFINKYGSSWRKVVGWNGNGDMGYLYGTEIFINDEKFIYRTDDGWGINRSMLMNITDVRKMKLDKIKTNSI